MRLCKVLDKNFYLWSVRNDKSTDSTALASASQTNDVSKTFHKPVKAIIIVALKKPPGNTGLPIYKRDVEKVGN